jgi:hypothetical protein
MDNSEKPEAAIKNGQSRDIGNIGYTGHRTQTEDKQKQKHNTENKNENVMKISDFI